MKRVNRNILGKRRSKIEIIADILKKSKNPTKKTHIMYECDLSFSQLKRYLGFLKRTELIQRKKNNGAATYQTTENGQNFLKKYSDMAKALFSPHLDTLREDVTTSME